jgi:hypothetical protein
MVVIAVNLSSGKPVSFKLRVAGDSLPPFFNFQKPMPLSPINILFNIMILQRIGTGRNR